MDKYTKKALKEIFGILAKVFGYIVIACATLWIPIFIGMYLINNSWLGGIIGYCIGMFILFSGVIALLTIDRAKHLRNISNIGTGE